jgi:ATP-dependent protease ClpP protease subunit
MQNPTRDRVRAFLGGKSKRPRIEAAAGSNEATVYVYDYIGWLGVEAEPFVRELAALQVDTIHVRINSPGGDVFDGRTIANALKHHRAHVVCHVDGLAASIASIIAIAGDEVRMAEGSFMMVHNPWVFAIGDANDLRELAYTLDKIGASLRDSYVQRSGIDAGEIQRMMDEETWMDAAEAVALGFADVAEGQEGDESASARFDLSVFDHAPEQLAAAHGERRKRSRPPTIRECEARFREDLGLSHAEARRAAAAVYRTDPAPRDEDEGLAGVLAALERRGTALATTT